MEPFLIRHFEPSDMEGVKTLWLKLDLGNPKGAITLKLYKIR
jgi:hypothetical protein